VATPDYFRQKTGGLAALLALVGMTIALVHSAIYPPKLPPINYADGTYRNKECGSIQFRAGTVVLGSTSLNYTLERHKDGVSALPSHMVQVERDKAGCHLLVDPSREAMYLSFGRDAPPRTVQLWDVRESTPYLFSR
jgi:hypothetical protein